MSSHRVGWAIAALSLCLVGLIAVTVLLNRTSLILLSVFALGGVLLLATLPRAIRTCRRGFGSLPRPTEAQIDALARSLAYTNPTYVPFELALDLRLLTDDQLDKAWRDSQIVLMSCSGRRDWLRAVEERGRYLAEFERRHPRLLRAWLTSEAGAPDMLLPYAKASRLEPPTIDWDQLIGGQATDR